MAQIPKNRIVENQYTNGTGIGKNLALRFTISRIPYIGFYNIINGNKYFTGKTYTEASRPLEKYNILQAAANTIASIGSIATKANSIIYSQPGIIRYFYKDLNVVNIKIKEIDKKAYDQLSERSDTSFQVISYNPKTQTLEDVNKQMPGLREFLVT
jgi:hypothetical protein